MSAVAESIAVPATRLMANALRMLAIDAVEAAKSGHPGMPMGMAEIAVALWDRHLKHNPRNPAWPDRDRFVLSNGHGSMLLYGLLHLTGYELPIDELKRFRQLHSKTPGHPEVGVTPGVETTTGPLGQGLANAVGMALAEALLAREFNRPGIGSSIIARMCSLGDGCLMEGISHEAASLAGTLKLDKLTVLYDDNGISIDGHVAAMVRRRYAGALRGVWLARACARSTVTTSTRSIARCKAHAVRAEADADLLQDGDRQGRAVEGGHPRRARRAARRRRSGADAPMRSTGRIRRSRFPMKSGAVGRERAWRVPPKPTGRERFRRVPRALSRLRPPSSNGACAASCPRIGATWSARLVRDANCAAESIATRKASQQTIEALARALPEMLGGSADLTGSNLTDWKGAVDVHSDDAGLQGGNYLHYGVREFGMSAVMNGIALHRGYLPFGGTFLTFSDYSRNALRMAALMKTRAIFVFTHDSIGLGEDGPTHQAVEHAASLRLIPGLDVWRPCDTVETAQAWICAVERDGPSCLLLSRQNLPFVARSDEQIAAIERGGYVLRDWPADRRMRKVARGAHRDRFRSRARARCGRALLEPQASPRASCRCPRPRRSTGSRARGATRCCRRACRASRSKRASARSGGNTSGSKAGWSASIRFGESAPAAALFEHFNLTAQALVDEARRVAQRER